MNKYQKEKSREIRDIMRTDKWGKMTYKEAKRKWRNGIRAFPAGSTLPYKAFDLGKFGLSRSKLRELRQAYAEIVKYAVAHGLDFRWEFESPFDQYVLRFTGTNYNTGERHGFRTAVSGDAIRQSTCSLVFLAKYILERLDREVQIYGIGLKPEFNYKFTPVYDSMVLQPMCFVLGRT